MIYLGEFKIILLQVDIIKVPVIISIPKNLEISINLSEENSV